MISPAAREQMSLWEVNTVQRQVIGVAISVCLVAGCTAIRNQLATSTADDDVSIDEKECNRNGGVWRPVLNLCDS